MSARRWGARVREVAARMRELGANPVEGLVASGAKDAQLAQLADRFGVALAGDLEAMLREHALLRGSWFLPPGFALPEPLAACLTSQLDLSLDGVLRAEASRQDWVREVFGDRDEPGANLWHATMGLHRVGNGDVLGIIRSGKEAGGVVYLSHERSRDHCWLLAPSVTAFVERWSRLAFVGPESWALRPFVGKEGYLDADGPAARQLRQALGLVLD